jgi:HJR/Mrr/RecB family endonuclease
LFLGHTPPTSTRSSAFSVTRGTARDSKCHPTRDPARLASLDRGMQTDRVAAEDEDLYDRVILGLVTRVSGRTAALITMFLYAAGLLVPIALGWAPLFHLEANLIGTALAASVGFGWLLIQLQARDRRHLLEWTSNLRLLTAQEFEWLVGELFRREGWKVGETGRQGGPDGNIDLVLARDAERRIVQCKRWTAWQVGVDDIRAFAGTLLREGLPGGAGTFVTLSDFTDSARTEAATTGIVLLDNHDLYGRIEKVRRPEPCPICASPMLLGRSPHGWWFRCQKAGCRGKRDLGSDPASAVELLTQQH